MEGEITAKILENNDDFLSHHRSFWHRTFSPMGPASMRGAILIMIMTAFGTGIYTFHQLFHSVGFYFAWGMIVYFAIIFYLSTKYLSAALMQFQQSKTISELVKNVLGNHISKIHDLLFVVYCFLVGVCMTLGINKTLYRNFEAQIWKLIPVDPSKQNFGNFNFYFSYIITIILFFLIVQKSVDRFRYFSFVSFAINVYIILISIIQAPSYYNKLKEKQEDQFNWKDFSVISVVSTFGILLFANNSIPNFFSVVKMIDNPTTRRKNRVFIRTFVTLMLTFLCFGTAAYFSLGVKYSPDVDLFIYRKPIDENSSDILMFIGRALLTLSLAVGAGLNCYPLKITICEVLGIEPNNRSNFIISIVITIGLAIVVSICDNITNYVAFTGSLCVSFLSVVTPFAMAVKLKMHTSVIGKVFLISQILLFSVLSIWGATLSLQKIIYE